MRVFDARTREIDDFLQKVEKGVNQITGKPVRIRCQSDYRKAGPYQLPSNNAVYQNLSWSKKDKIIELFVLLVSNKRVAFFGTPGS